MPADLCYPVVMLQIAPPQVDPRFAIEPFEPAYRNISADEMAERVRAARRELEDCCACPRNCHVNRMADERMVCNVGRHALVASSFAHFGEEDCLRGWNGSGTIFFGSCNLRCVFCQNWDISQRRAGRELTSDRIADIMLALQAQGCHNINFVTPEHVAPQVVEAIAEAVPRGLTLPIVYNTSAYDAAHSLRMLDGLVDIYMPDFKFWKRETAARMASATDYPDRAREAISEMHRQVGPLRFSPKGMARRGVLVRHLVMPGQLDEADAIFRWLADEISPDTYVNIMGQYRPEYKVGKVDRHGRMRHTNVNRRPEQEELSHAYAAARRHGLWRFDERW